MTREEMIILFNDKVPEEKDTRIINAYLEDSKYIILNRIYEVVDMPEDIEVPTRYHNLQVRIAIELYSKRGAEGETAHSENGINRSYASASVSPSLLKEIKRKVGTIKCAH